MAVKPRAYEATDAVEPVSVEQPYPSPTYSWYVVAVLLTAYVFSFIDRQILSLLVGPMKADLGISDTQMSYLMGISFALFYTFFGIPLGRVADTRSRRSLIAAGMVVWSFMTAGCGLARQYWQLALLRIGVGVGEAALSPAAYSLLTDYFPKHRLGTALSVYSMGIFIGSGLAYLLGGLVVGFATAGSVESLPLIGEIRSWQIVFLAVGLPGILFALLMYTVREPARRGVRQGHGTGPSVGEVVRYMRANARTLFCHNFGFAMLALIAYGSAAWIPSFLQRTYGWTVGEVGLRYGFIVMVAGSAGIVFGGYLADRFAQKGRKDGKLRAGLIAAVLCIPCSAIYPLMPSGWLALAAMVPFVFVQAMPFGVAPAAVQEMMPPRMRGQATATYLFVVTLVGLGVGPTAIALPTDYVFGDPLAVRYSLLVVGIVASVVSTVLLAAGVGAFRRSMDYLQVYQGGNR